MAEFFVNDPGTTLNGTINNSVTSLVVASSSGYPSSGNFRIRIDSELMLVTAVSGTTWTVTRGIESTSAASHTNGATINHVVSAGGLTQVVTDTHQTGGYSSRPSAPANGNEYFSTNSVFNSVYTGGSWKNFGPSYPYTTTPLASSFTVNGAGSLVDSNGCLILNGSNNAFTAAMATAPATPYTFEAGVHFLISGSGAAYGISTSDGTKYKHFFFNLTGVFIQYNTALNTFSSLPFQQSTCPIVAPFTFFKLVNNGTTRTYHIGDGTDYVQVYSESNTADFTSTTIGLSVFGGTNTINAVGKYFSYKIS